MNRVLFIRHGEGIDNVERQFSYKRVDRSLTERGRLQARQTAEHLAGRHIDDVYCSPMKRAHETAEIIAARLGLPPVVLEEFREVNVGKLEGREFNDETWAVYHRTVNEWFTGNISAAMPGGEDYSVIWNRTRRGFEQMLNGRTDCTLVLVGHAGIFTATLKDLCPGLDLNWLMNTEYYNCAITELEIEVQHGALLGRLITWANHSHLSKDALSRMPGIPPMGSEKKS